MTSAQISTLLTDYEKVIRDNSLGLLDSTTAADLLEMIPKMRAMNPNVDDAINKERIVIMRHFFLQREQLMRWLGFMQGIFDLSGVFDVAELGKHNVTGRVGAEPSEPE